MGSFGKGGWGDAVTTQNGKIVVEPRGDGGARLAEKCLERGLEQGSTVGVEMVLIGIYVGNFGVLSLGSRGRRGGIVVTYIISLLPSVT